MGFMDKLKGFFYDEEEIEEVEIPKKVKKNEKKVIKPIIKEEKEIPERELFRAERTFNFPMDMDDGLDFVPVKPSIKEERNDNTNIESTNIRKEIKKESIKSQDRPSYYSKKVKNDEEEKKFRPTPIISPIYGIVEGSISEPAKKESNSYSRMKDTSITKKIDFDTVRKKAYGDIHADNDEEEENKGLFFNLVDEEKESISNENENNIENESKDEDEIKITYNDVDYDEEKDDEDEIEIPKITRLKKNKDKAKEEKEEDAILFETKEQDLFNLIDNMYNSEEDEEEK